MSAPAASGHGPKPSIARVVATSFAAGALVMALLGLATPLIAKGSFAVPSAEAAVIRDAGPAVEPIDVGAVKAQLAGVEASMGRITRATDPAVARLRVLATQE